MRPAAFAPFDWQERYFASGANTAAEIRGFTWAGYHVGVSASEVSEAALDELSALAHTGLRVFVDSGAFSEVEEQDGRLVIVAPIEDAEWMRRLDIAHEVAVALREQAHIVAPDRVGDQVVTLERLARFGEQIAAIAATGARLIVPIQRGHVRMGEFYFAVLKALGVVVGDFIPGVPANKDATPLPELRRFADVLGSVGCEDVHLLGCGYRNPGFRAAYEVLQEYAPGIRVWSDSCALAAKVGQGRPITVAQQELDRQRAITQVMLAETRRLAQAARRAGWFDDELEVAPGVPIEADTISYGEGGPFGERQGRLALGAGDETEAA